MRFRSILTLALASVTLGTGGCNSASQPKPRPSVAVAIAAVGAETVSAGQVARIHQTLRPEIEGAGFVFADRNATADLVLTVSFTPIPGSPGGRIKLTSLEPTAEFRRATEGGESVEAKQFRRLERELQSIVEAQSRNPDYR